MQAYVVNHPGGPEALELTTVPKPVVKPGWTRVKVLGFGINHSEIFTREGKSPSVQLPRILGIEVVGVVDETSAPDQLTPGQRVVSIMGEMGRAYDGSYAEYVLLPNSQVYPIQTDLPLPSLVATPETYYTAFGIFNSLRLQATDSVLIRAATSGVGIAALKLIKAFNPKLTVTGTTRRAAKESALLAAGFDAVIVAPDSAKLPAATGNFDKIIDLIGPLSAKDSLQHLNDGGIVNVTGELGGVWTIPDFDPISDIPNNGYLTGFSSGDVSEAKLQALFDFIHDYHVDVQPARVFAFKDVPAAHAYLQATESFGKVIVLMDDAATA
ncbi:MULTISPECIES: zinc-binding alcohol dehydrogenase family protein [Lactiplantibacillus]|uniref:Zinc-binding alcohol dehydrogenase family protein n=1 Tax=Lactiplantibacillus pentosus TaxID=1589 RepID=A0AAP5PZA1_LACPE|nr:MULTISPECIES: zinc-binding alcohol dehydrogenase family protein [Lactiplantibacillus]AUI78619.1 quinone oxidoreductase [Lactiplantibacillus pentosus]MBO9165711.1 zinc-binding dehydrogenase [Lactiplantibacillus pentosus]MBU7463019.1 zinc-binding dehydrogenase [Lactiplantibacillus pentosus]MBU7475389.1 zinc-binding dehydrogenase [Lactiplantibacillus pentosus]MBU7476371.1 zinc-binding dehydrogenase [Lactiplantibacillus pentosus]